MDGNVIKVSPGAFQPITADDVAPLVADAALAPPKNRIVDIRHVGFFRRLRRLDTE